MKERLILSAFLVVSLGLTPGAGQVTGSASISLRVVGFETGRPIAGNFTVVLVTEVGPTIMVPNEPHLYERSGLPPGAYPLVVIPDWPYSYRFRILELGAGRHLNLTIELKKSVSIYGQLTLTDGRPASGLRVQAIPVAAAFSEFFGWSYMLVPSDEAANRVRSLARLPSAQTGPDGWFWLGDRISPDSPFVLEVSGPHFPWVSPTIQGTSGEWIRRDLEIQLEAGRTLRGTVYGSKGSAPAAGAEVTITMIGPHTGVDAARAAAHSLGWHQVEIRKAKTDGHGRFSVSGLAAARYLIAAHDQFEEGTARVILSEEVTDIRIVLGK